MRTAILIISLIMAGNSASAQPVAQQPDRLSGYADIADLALAAPVVARATITNIAAVSVKQAGSAPAGRVRLVVTARLANLLVAPGPLAPTLSWLWDAPVDAKGRAPKAKGMEILAFLAAPGPDGGTRLVSRRAMQAYDPALADSVRAIIAENRSGTVPVIIGVSNGFRADGTLPGESESQFFLTSSDGRPTTLVVQNRPGEVRRVLVARGDIIDESAQRAQPGTLLWYRLACFLPLSLPARAGGGDAALARDWRDAMASLGPCGRTGQNEASSTPTARQSG
jgi:hypothetical protein